MPQGLGRNGSAMWRWLAGGSGTPGPSGAPCHRQADASRVGVVDVEGHCDVPAADVAVGLGPRAPRDALVEVAQLLLERFLIGDGGRLDPVGLARRAFDDDW